MNDEYNPLLNVELSELPQVVQSPSLPRRYHVVTPVHIRPVTATPLSPNDLSLMMSQTTEAKLQMANIELQAHQRMADAGNYQANVDGSIRSNQARIGILSNNAARDLDFSVNNTPKPSNWADSPDPTPQFPPKLQYTEKSYEYTSMYDTPSQLPQPSAPEAPQQMYYPSHSIPIAQPVASTGVTCPTQGRVVASCSSSYQAAPVPSSGYVISEYKSIYDS
jgi:hypothetical protein